MTTTINSGGQNRVPLYDNLKAIGIVLVTIINRFLLRI